MSDSKISKDVTEATNVNEKLAPVNVSLKPQLRI